MKKATKTLTASKKAVAVLKTSLTVDNHQLVQSETFLEALETISLMQEAIDEFWESFQAFMEEQGIEPVKGSWGHITLAERTTLAADETVKPRFLKQVLDPAKIRAFQTFHDGQLPAGVSAKKTKYLSKKLHI